MTQATADRIRGKCQELAEFLAEKNASYGDSALAPLGIFGSGDPVANLSARIDDKLARIKNAPGAYGEDALKDLTGYMVLLSIAIEDRTAAPGIIRIEDLRNCVIAPDESEAWRRWAREEVARFSHLEEGDDADEG